YDGEFGVIKFFDESEKQAAAGQMALFAQQAKEISKPTNRTPRKKNFKKRK
ncbi:MAG: hypothetical protein JRI74_11670, partial [Deltaproteobacteria bacterium]|nr:hypothetical protein [Deltaproteobacteria bacterium]